ncbi:hypothetical protein BHE74_00035837, partial [Ensete ventricosum]
HSVTFRHLTSSIDPREKRFKRVRLKPKHIAVSMANRDLPRRIIKGFDLLLLGIMWFDSSWLVDSIDRKPSGSLANRVLLSSLPFWNVS